MWLKSNLLSRGAVGGVEVHELGFEVVAAVVASRTALRFGDVCARLDVRIKGLSVFFRILKYTSKYFLIFAKYNLE